MNKLRSHINLDWRGLAGLLGRSSPPLALLLVIAAAVAIDGAMPARAEAYTVEMIWPEMTGPEMTGPEMTGPEMTGPKMSGPEINRLRGLLDTTSTLIKLKDETAPSEAGLRRRADGDSERLLAALRSEGYYDGSLDIKITSDDIQPTVTIKVNPGPVYGFGRVEVVAAPGTTLPIATPPVASSNLVMGMAHLGLSPGLPARGPLVVAAEQRAIDAFARAGFAFAKSTARLVEIDRATKTMNVTLTIDAGPVVRLGGVLVSGQEQVDPALVKGRVAWIAGELYSPELIERTRIGLIGLGVFSTVRLTIGESAEPDGSHTVNISVTERKRRLIGLGATFSSSEGLGGQAYWGHRNLFGGGESLRIGAELSRLSPRTLSASGLELADEKLNGELRTPDFGRVNQDLVITGAGINEHPRAYHRQALITQARIETRLSRHLTLGWGIAGDHSNLRDTARFSTATLAGTPLSLAYDCSDSLIDPTTGYRLALESTPWLRFGVSGRSFVVNRITQSSYYDLGTDGHLVAAGRISFGSIFGDDTTGLPADKRFFAGGGGSIRGYAYQAVGPVNAASDPLGGGSLVETSVELRIRITEDLGVVPFIDGGNVYTSSLPKLAEGLRLGSGLGMRYYTGFGPLRLDFGLPVRGRRNDHPFQVYLSLGQAF